MMTMNLDALERAAVAGTMKWRDAHALVSLARQLMRLRAVARDFYNTTVANPELRLSASNKKIRDEAIRAGERLRESLEATAPGAPTPLCATCNDHGMIGGPSYYSPDEGGVPCPECAAPAPASVAFQARVKPWMLECFGAEIAADAEERNHRFLEEALELVQACGCTSSEAHQLVDYVFDRPAGEKRQEIGGVMVTLAALCLAQSLDMHEAGEIELTRIWTKVDQIRAKQAAKPKHSPLPVHTRGDTHAENTAPISAHSAAITPGTLPYPTEPTDALLEVLGLMLYTTTPIAYALRAAGTDIPKRCEEEQAHVLHWLIQLALQHGTDWRERARKSIEELQAATQAASEVRA